MLAIDRFKELDLRKKVLIVCVIALALRLLLSGLHQYDIFAWYRTAVNIMADGDMYSLDSHYYTPLWGYMLALSTSFANLVFGIPVLGVDFPEMCVLMDDYCFNSVIVNPWYILLMKIPLFIGDFIVAYLCYRTVFSWTQDENKAVMAMALVLLSPLVILESGMHCMFDIYTALFLLLCLLLLHRKNYVVAGLMFGMGVFLKIFPAFAVFAIAVYLFHVSGRQLRPFSKALALGVLGILIAFMITFIPTFIDGTFGRSWSFITGRVETASNALNTTQSFVDRLMDIKNFIALWIMGAAFVFTAYVAVRFNRSLNDPSGSDERKLFYAAMIMIAAGFMWPVMAQYLILLLPFICIHAATYSNRRYLLSWALISIGGFLFLFFIEGIGGSFLSLSTFTGWPDGSTMVEFAEKFVSFHKVEEYGLLQVLFIGSGIVTQFIGIASLFIWRYKHIGGEDHGI